MVPKPILPAIAALLAACSPNYSPDTYNAAAVQQAAKVEQGSVAGVRKVGVTASGATGAVTGAAAGGIAGSTAPGGTVGTALGALGGSVIGGLVGSGVERATGDTTAFEYIVRKANNELISVTQKDAVPLAIGARVLVIAGPQARIVPDYTVPAEPARPAEPPKPADPPTTAAPSPPPVTSEPIPPPAPEPASAPGPIPSLAL